MTLSNKALATREKILVAAGELFYLHGYTATGLDKIIKAAGVTKGNFYYYFKSKEKLAVSVLESHFEQMYSEIQSVMQQSETPLDNLFLALNNILRHEQEQFADGNIRGCFFGNITLEMSVDSEIVRQKVDSIFNRYRELFSQLLSEAKEEKQVAETLDVNETAELVLSMMEGALILDKARQRPKAVEKAIKFLKTYLKG